jgi:protein-tyrosine phosphatase
LQVTFVCLGNICRSPMAATMFGHQLEQRGLGGDVLVSSAGTAADLAVGRDGRTWGVLRKHGFPDPPCAAQVNASHLSADLVVALDRHNAHDLAKLGVPAERMRLLRSFVPHARVNELDVRNPYYGTPGDFQRCFDTIGAALPGLHHWVDSQLARHRHRPPPLQRKRRTDVIASTPCPTTTRTDT